MIEDYSHTLLEQEEMHFYSCVADVLRAFQCHGAGHILHEVMKNPQLKQELTSLFLYNSKP
jgi:hypothetical protein